MILLYIIDVLTKAPKISTRSTIHSTSSGTAQLIPGHRSPPNAARAFTKVTRKSTGVSLKEGILSGGKRETGNVNKNKGWKQWLVNEYIMDYDNHQYG